MLGKIIIYTDGACSGNPGPGGWGAVIQYSGDFTKTLSGYEIDTTNNRMEMKAAIEALKSLQQTYEISLYTDSKYLYNGITQWIDIWIIKNWHNSQNKIIKNFDLWYELYNLSCKHKITWHWVKSHSNNLGNNFADKLAVTGKKIAIEKSI